MAATSPPSFLRLAAHPLRWRLLSELARSDRRVRELCSLSGRPQSLVSYHLGQLRSEGLVSSRRSSASGRDVYYGLDLARCSDLLAAAGAALHPGLLASGAPARGTRASVLFLCTGNSARSQMAEALAERYGIQACSAGSNPKPLHPGAVQAMRNRGIDIAGRRSKHFEVLAGRRFDYVVSLCDRVREVCPEFPGHPEFIHWSIPDPSRESDPAAYERAAAEIAARMPFLVTLIKEAS